MSIASRDHYVQLIHDEFGAEASDKCWKDMQEATEDAAGIVRHNYEAEFARRRLEELRNAKGLG